MESIIVDKVIPHPLEDAFGIAPGTTVIQTTEVVKEEPVLMPTYDAKDQEIEGKLEEIYAAAMAESVAASDAIATVEGKYKAKLGEVSASMLNVALGAVREKASMKSHKDKLVTRSMGGPTNNTTNNNLIVADRNELLRMMNGTPPA